MDRNEAIEIVRMCCPKISNSKCDFETAMRVLVPELKESEDERIRKFLVDYFEVIKSTLTDGMWKGFQIDKILALLEKQGEQKSDSFKAEHGKYYYCIKDYFNGGKSKLLRVMLSRH